MEPSLFYPEAGDSQFYPGTDVLLIDRGSDEEGAWASGNALCLLLVAVCMVFIIVLLVTVFVLTKTDTDLSDEGADGGNADRSEDQGRAGGVRKPPTNQGSTQTSGMTPPVVVPLRSTFVPQTAVAAAPTPAVATTPKPVLATTPKPAAVAPRTRVVATTPKTTAAAPPTPVVATTPRPVLATTRKPVLATTPKPAAVAPPTPADVIPPTPARKPPTPMRAPSTTTVVPKPPTAGQTTRPGPTTQAPLPKGSLLCTLGAGFKKSKYTFPPDGLCTIITFHSVYKGDDTLAPPYKEDFQYFLDTSKQAKYSQFGIGIAQETCTDRATMTKLTSNVSTKMHLDELWDRYRIYHYGQVSGSILFRGLVPFISATLAATGLQGTSISLLAATQRFWPSNMMYAMSLGMAGRWYAACHRGPLTRKGPDGYTLGNRCGAACKEKKLLPEDQITEIARACSRPAFNNSFYQDRTFNALVSYDDPAGLVFTYDSPRNLRTKLCKAKKNATSVQYTFVAADIQLEDAHGICGYGPFPRLYMLKKLAAFFAYNYTSAGKETQCRAVTY
ncbi:uncharacterized protein [Dermacentor albipictus]|uniref:uncharacterized protein isoform X6 n=1 Tax=Dermacentor albipictus TaxID=60249 RepID=UPI0031FBE4CD